METCLTEFSYGYCVTEEFANGIDAGLKAAPYFPSLYIEGKAGGGFDVRIGSALFLQFKLCHELTRGTARECQMGLLSPRFIVFTLASRHMSIRTIVWPPSSRERGTSATETHLTARH
jgi:hypothetical protein